MLGVAHHNFSDNLPRGVVAGASKRFRNALRDTEVGSSKAKSKICIPQMHKVPQVCIYVVSVNTSAFICILESLLSTILVFLYSV